MLSQLEQERQRKVQADKQEMIASLLNNTKVIENMEGEGNKRQEETRNKRMKADGENLKRDSERKNQMLEERAQWRRDADTLVPFYERLQKQTEELDAKQIQESRKLRESAAIEAAQKDGKCILNTTTIKQLSLLDEERAIRESQERQGKVEAEREARAQNRK